MAEDTPASARPKPKPIDIKAPKPADIEQFIAKPAEGADTDEYDLEGFTSLVSSFADDYADEDDETRTQKSLDEAFEFHSKRLGISQDALKAGVSKYTDPNKIAHDISVEKKDPKEVYTGLKARTLAGVSTQERAVKQRGEIITQLGGLRAEAGIGRTVKETGEVHESLRERPAHALKIQEERAGFFGTDVEDVNELPQEGDAVFEELKYLSKMIHEGALEDASLARIIELKHRFGNDETGAQDYIDNRSQDILNSKNIRQPGEAEAKRLTAEEYEKLNAEWAYQVKKSKDRAINEIAMWKTIGMWTAPAFVRWHGAQDTEDLEWKDVFKPTVEIVGMNRNSKPIGRIESGLQWGMEINDIVQSAATGVISEAEGSLNQKALKGVSERQNLLEAALASDMAKSGTAGKIAAGTSGFLASILFPDLTFGAAGGYAATRKAVTRGLTMGKAKKAMSLKEDAAKALARGLDGDRASLKEAAKASSDARDIAPKAMDEVDTNDFNVGRRLGKHNPDIMNGKQGKDLAARLPGELGEYQMNMHPSIRRRTGRRGGPAAKEVDEARKVPGIGYEEVYDYGRQLDLVDETRALVNANDNAVYARFIKKDTTRISSLLQTALDEITGINVARVFSSAQDMSLLARDSATWKNAALRALDEEMVKAGTKDPAHWRGGVESVLDEMIDIAKKTIDEGDDFDDLAMLVNRAEEAIKTNIEARAVAHALQREIMAGQLGLKIAPIIEESTGKVSELMGRKMSGSNLEYMSEKAIQFMDEIVEKTDIPKEHALEAAVILDLRAKMEARKSGFNEARYWKDRIAGIGDRADFMRKLYAPPAPYDPKAVALASLPEGFTVESKEGKWLIENAEGVSYSSSKADAIDAAAEAIDKLVDEGLITKSDLDLSSTRVGPLLLGQPISVAEDVIRRLPIEYAMAHTDDGVHVIRQTSNAPNYVAFSTPDINRLMQAENLVFTHNHPGGSAFSDADIIVSMHIDAREIRATQNSGGVWSMVFPDGFGDYSKAVLREKYGSLSAVPKAKTNARRAFEQEIRDAATASAREAHEKVRSQDAKEALDRTGASQAWGAYYSEAFVGTSDEAGVLSGGRLGEVFERRGIKRILTRVEPEDTGVRIRPGDEPTFGETARRAATQQGVDLLLQLRDSPAGQARQVDLAEGVLARGADGHVTAKASPEFIDPAEVMSDPRYARTDGGKLIILDDATKAAEQTASRVKDANKRIIDALMEWNPESVQWGNKMAGIYNSLSHAQMSLTHAPRAYVQQHGFSIPNVSSSIANLQSARQSLRRLSAEMPKELHEKILDELQSLDQLMDDHIFASMVGPPKIARRAGPKEIVYTGPAPKLSDVRKLSRELELEMADIRRQREALLEGPLGDKAREAVVRDLDDELLKRSHKLGRELDVVDLTLDATRGYREEDATRLGLDQLGRDLASPEGKKYFFFGSRGTKLDRGVSDVFKRLGIDEPEQYFELLPQSAQATKEQVLREVNASPWFHGTATPDVVGGKATLDQWERTHSGTAAGSMLGHGLYLASNPEVSIRYAGKLYARGADAIPTAGRQGRGVLKTVDVKVRDVLDLRTDTLSEMLQQLEDSGAKVAARKIDEFIEAEASKIAAGLPRHVKYKNNSKLIKAEILNDWGALKTWKALMAPGELLNDVEFTEDLLKAGIDGVLHHGVQDGDVLVLFDPNANTLRNAKKAIQREGRPIPEQLYYQKPTTQQTGFEFREVGDDLVEITSREIRDAIGDAEGIDVGLTFKVEGGVLRIESAALPDAVRGRGFGTELYLKALSRAADAGLGFASDVSPSPDAIALYERLIDAGAPLRRKMVEAADGNMVRQYEATAEEVKKFGLKLDVAKPPAAARDVFKGLYKDKTKPHALDDRYRVWPKGQTAIFDEFGPAPEVSDVHIEMLRVFRDRQGTGEGSRILRDITQMADESNATLSLEPITKGGPLSDKDLFDWYSRHGFEPHPEFDELLIRKPTPKPPAATAAKIDTPEFKTWFGKSKVVDEAGEPLVVYHGTTGDFDAFDKKFLSEATRDVDAAEGFYFTSRPEVASTYAESYGGREFKEARRRGVDINPYTGGTRTITSGANVMPVYLSIENPRVIEFDPTAFFTPLDPKITNVADEFAKARRAGHDGIIFKNVRDDPASNIVSDVYIPFRNTQIKSQFNIGTFDPVDSRILKQEIDDTAKGAVEFMDDGRAIIYAFEEADFSTLVHEIGHIIRRDLDPADMDEVLGWVKELGADVTVTAGRFMGEPDEVRKAEEFFAEAFENYIMTGEAPVKGLEGMFQRMKEFMLDIYKTISPVAKPSPAIKKTFDKLLMTEPPSQPVFKRVMNLIGTEIFGPTDDRKLNEIREISREAQRLGIPNADYDTLIEQFDETGKITLDKEIFSSRYGGVGKSEFGPNDLSDLRANMENEIAANASTFRPGVATTSAAQGLSELKPTERIEQMLRGDTATAKVASIVKSTFMGGDVVAEKQLASLVPEVRASVETATREVQQGAGEVIRLAAEGAEGPGSPGWDNLLDYLSGKNVQYTKGGRNVFTSGHDSATAIFSAADRWFKDTLDSDKLDLLVELANRTAKGERLESVGFAVEKRWLGGAKLTLKNAMEEVWMEAFVSKSTAPVFFKDLLTAINPSTAGGAPPLPKEFRHLTEILMYHAGYSERKGLKFTGTSRQQIESFLGDLRTTFKAEPASRAAILVGVHGHADRARKLWAGLGIAVDETAKNMYIRWLNGEDIPPEYIGRVKKMVKQFGMKTEFVETGLLDTTFYVPQAARNRLGEAITRGTDPTVAAKYSEDNITGLKGVVLRYMKTRMTRGGVTVRQRYFLMNTIDHFVQMAIINGFRPALSSTLRLIAQDVMVLPGVARTIDLMERGARAGGVPKHLAEGLRRQLQTGGDAVGRFMSGAKYNLNVNPILEGADGYVRLGGNVYSYKELREIAVQEGIFASFDTSQLANSVQRAGRDLLVNNKKEAKKAGMLQAKASRYADQTGEFLTQVVADTAEAWAERERLGAMVSIMEFGTSPRVAARLTIDSLYDYAGSMSKMDRAWFVSLALSFWAFQKNANRQIINAMLSPGGAYRMGVLRRSQERGAELLSDLLYYSVTDEYGVDTEAMSLADEALYEEYITLRDKLEDHYDEKGEKVPDETKTAFRMWVAGRSSVIDNGKIIDLSETFKKMAGGGISKEPRSRFVEFTRGPISPSKRRTYLRERTGIPIPVSLQREAVRRYYNAIDSKTDDHPYIEVFVPDSTINAGYRHIINLASFYILSLDKATDFIQDPVLGTDSAQEGIRGVSPMTALRQVVDLERSLIASDVIREATSKPGYPRRVHPWVANLVEEAFGVNLHRTSPKDDMMGIPDKREGVEFQQERVYMFPGVWQIAFDNSPLGELNSMMMQQSIGSQLTPLEKESARGQMIAWARAVTGVQTAETSGAEAARREEPTRITTTKRPD